MPKDERIYVGVDLGGTKILAVAFDSKLKVLATEKAKTPRDAHASSVVAALTEAVREAIDRVRQEPRARRGRRFRARAPGPGQGHRPLHAQHGVQGL